MSILRLLALVVAVNCASIEVEVDGVLLSLFAGPKDNPLEVAERFCEEHDLTRSIEGLDCSSTLSEELISDGARHPLPQQPALRLNSHNLEEAVRDFCEEEEECFEELLESASRVVPPEALGLGILYVPVAGRRVVTPTIRKRVNASFGYSHFGSNQLEEKELLAWSSEAITGREAASFCVAHLCPNRIETTSRLLSGTDQEKTRVVVSMSTLPGRISFLATQLSYLEDQTRPPDKLYAAIPYYSLRERKEYVIPDDLRRAQERGTVVLLRSEIDWGPATKLIPVLSVEISPRTIIVTLDDDIRYPLSLLEDLVQGAERHPSAAVGFRGYRLPPPTNTTIESEDEDYYAHDNLVYVDSADLDSADERVDALGGLAGVAYRSGFFDLKRLVDYDSWDGGAFFVDDDWISLVLEEARVPRFVLRNSRAATALRDEPIVSPHHTVSALNAPDHAFRNIKFQAELLEAARDRGLFATQQCRQFEALRFLERCSNETTGLVPRAETDDRSTTYVFASSHPSSTSLRLLDDFLGYHGGVQYAVVDEYEEMDDATSLHTTLHESSSFFWNNLTTTILDLFLVGEHSKHPLADFAAILGSGSFRRGHTVLAVENNPRARPLHDFLQVHNCQEQRKDSTQHFQSWRCD